MVRVLEAIAPVLIQLMVACIGSKCIDTQNDLAVFPHLSFAGRILMILRGRRGVCVCMSALHTDLLVDAVPAFPIVPRYFFECDLIVTTDPHHLH